MRDFSWNNSNSRVIRLLASKMEISINWRQGHHRELEITFFVVHGNGRGWRNINHWNHYYFKVFLSYLDSPHNSFYKQKIGDSLYLILMLPP